MEQEKRRKNTIKKLKKAKIAFLSSLPYVESSSEVKLKSLDEICSRAVTALCAVQVACDVANGGDVEESRKVFKSLLENYGLWDNLIACEKKVFESEDTKNAVNVTWEYEAFWSLVWALGLIENNEMEKPYSLCDCEKAIKLVFTSSGLDDFKSKCHLRDIEEILDMLDLYYCYHWAIVEKEHINPETQIGKLNGEVVFERRKGLEWLICEEKDWNDISLDT